MTEQEMRELGDWVAVNVMGWTQTYAVVKDGLYYRPDEHGYTGRLCEAGHYTRERAKALLIKGENMHTVSHDRPDYTEPAHAMAVLKKCAEKLKRGVIGVGSPMSGQKWVVGHIGEKSFDCEAETLELAICKFAKALYTK